MAAETYKMSASAVIVTILLFVLLIGGGLVGCPYYKVWERKMAGQAELQYQQGGAPGPDRAGRRRGRGGDQTGRGGDAPGPGLDRCGQARLRRTGPGGRSPVRGAAAEGRRHLFHRQGRPRGRHHQRRRPGLCRGRSERAADGVRVTCR